MNGYYTETPAPETHLFDDLPRPVYASFGERLVATIIDSVLVGIANKVIQMVIGLDGRDWNLIFGSLLASVVLDWLYYALMESSSSQATVGKLVMGLKVTDLEGGRINFGRATGRFFGRYISGLILLIGYLMMLWDDRNQTLHDKMAGTLVVKKTTELLYR